MGQYYGPRGAITQLKCIFILIILFSGQCLPPRVFLHWGNLQILQIEPYVLSFERVLKVFAHLKTEEQNLGNNKEEDMSENMQEACCKPWCTLNAFYIQVGGGKCPAGRDWKMLFRNGTMLSQWSSVNFKYLEE